MITVIADQLRRAAPAGDPNIIAAIATTSGAVLAKYALNSRNRVLGFLSTALEESQFRTLSEDLNYSAVRAHEVFPQEFPTIASAEPYAMKPEAFADKVYGSRMGNRSGTDDGWLYRGRGLIQITGRNEFAALEIRTGLPLLAHPEMVADPAHLLECSVAQFVAYPGILQYCDAANWRAVWALVGTGRASGSVINLANHEAALAALQKAIPALVDAPDVARQEYDKVAALDQGEPVITHSAGYEQRIEGVEPQAPPAAFTTPAARLEAVKGQLAQITPTAAHEEWLTRLEADAASFFKSKGAA